MNGTLVRMLAPVIAVLPLVALLFPPAALVDRPDAEPPEIPAGAVAAVVPAGPGAVGIGNVSFDSLGEVDSGGTIDPFTGQSKEPVYIGVDGQRIDAARVRRFLERYRSPMSPHARLIVKTGKRFGMDPRLIVAIAGTESTFGKFAVEHNAWGWDAPRGLTRWPSWEVSIPDYTARFTSAYRSRDPSVIGPRYCPDCGSWPATTRLFFSQV